MTDQSNRTRVILIGGLIVLLIVAFSAFVISRVGVAMNTFFNRTNLPESVTARFFEAIRNQDYAAAYADLDRRATLGGQPVDESSLIQQTSEADAQRGPLLSYSLLKQSDAAAPSTTQIEANLQRGDQSTIVHLQLQQVGDRWKIISLGGYLFYIKRGLKWLGIGSVALLILGFVFQAASVELDKRGYLPPGQMVNEVIESARTGQPLARQ